MNLAWWRTGKWYMVSSLLVGILFFVSYEFVTDYFRTALEPVYLVQMKYLSFHGMKLEWLLFGMSIPFFFQLIWKSTFIEKWYLKTLFVVLAILCSIKAALLRTEYIQNSYFEDQLLCSSSYWVQGLELEDLNITIYMTLGFIALPFALMAVILLRRYVLNRLQQFTPEKRTQLMTSAYWQAGSAFFLGIAIYILGYLFLISDTTALNRFLFDYKLSFNLEEWFYMLLLLSTYPLLLFVLLQVMHHHNVATKLLGMVCFIMLSIVGPAVCLFFTNKDDQTLAQYVYDSSPSNTHLPWFWFFSIFFAFVISIMLWKKERIETPPLHFP